MRYTALPPGGGIRGRIAPDEVLWSGGRAAIGVRFGLDRRRRWAFLGGGNLLNRSPLCVGDLEGAGDVALAALARGESRVVKKWVGAVTEVLEASLQLWYSDLGKPD